MRWWCMGRGGREGSVGVCGVVCVCGEEGRDASGVRRAQSIQLFCL